MRSTRFGLLLFLLLLSLPVGAQQAADPQQASPAPSPFNFQPRPHGLPTSLFTPPPSDRDPQALDILQKAVSMMGNTIPVDSVATGSVNIIAGTKIDDGTVRIITRGIDQSSEQIQMPDQTNSVIYSRGVANEVIKGTVKPSSVQLAASSQSPDFPLPLLAATLNDPDLGVQYIGDETVDDLPVHHIRLWKTYASKQAMQRFWDFTTKDLWVDAATGLPRKLAYERREGGGSEPHVRMEVFYSDWRNASGVVYPYKIEKSWNGTPWTTITIQNVAFQTGLSDSDFPITLRKAVKP